MSSAPFSSPLVIAGATATGKTAVAQWIAERTGAAIVSADSMLVYRGMDVGTAKPTREERARVRYIGLDCVGPDEPFSVGDWLEAVRRGLSELPPETPIVVAGGTGLYIKALLQGLDSSPSNPEVRARYQGLFQDGGLDALRREIAARGIDLPPGDAANPRRLIRALERAEFVRDMAGQPHFNQGAVAGIFPPDTHVFCLDMPRDVLAERIRLRVAAMFEGGLVDEAVRLFGLRPTGGEGEMGPTASGAIGYAEALAYARGELTRDKAEERIAARTRQLAKRQLTWFRHQLAVDWVAVKPGEAPAALAARLTGR